MFMRLGEDADPIGVHIDLLSEMLLDGRKDLLPHHRLQGRERGIVEIVPGEFEFR